MCFRDTLGEWHLPNEFDLMPSSSFAFRLIYLLTNGFDDKKSNFQQGIHIGVDHEKGSLTGVPDILKTVAGDNTQYSQYGNIDPNLLPQFDNKNKKNPRESLLLPLLFFFFFIKILN